MAIYGGWRSIRAIWPALLVSGGSFALSQFAASNLIDYTLTDVLSSIGSLVATLLFLQVWRPKTDPEFVVAKLPADAGHTESSVPDWQGWLPWIIVSVTVILWTSFKLGGIGQQAIPWPGLHQAISITLYNDKPYAAVWTFQPMGTGTAILLASIVTAVLVRLSPKDFFGCIAETIRQCWLAVITVMLIVGLQGNRVKESCGEEACEEVVVPGGSFAPKAK